MKKIILLILLIVSNAINAQSIAITGNSYHVYGPNSNWGEYLKVGGNGRETTSASVVSTNGNLHLDSKDGSATYINHYSKGNTYINPEGGYVGIGNYAPDAPLTVYGVSNFYPVRPLNNGSGDSRSLSVKYSFTNPQFVNNLYPIILGTGGGNQPLILDAARVGIGTANPSSMLTVAGNIASREVKVTVDAGADFVFENNYNLPSLESIDKYIKENKHLPEIASADEMKKDGINLSEMNIKLLQKIEELTLYMIEQNRSIEDLKQEIKNINSK